ncbi:MAG: HK97 family phage prohead protease [Alphaproteobacteria bacterium]|nr:HK97 family phage prohead protease [Alphaproteobacteria bacterium]
MTDLVARFEGYAAVFNVADLNGDIIEPGAFAASLKRRPAEEVRLLYQHAPEKPLGRWLSFEEDARGLYAAGELVLSSSLARDVYALIEGRALDGLSIGFRTVRAQKHDRSARRFILEADLWEVSIVTFPMAPGARIARLDAPAPASSSPRAGAAVFAQALKGAAAILEARGGRAPGAADMSPPRDRDGAAPRREQAQSSVNQPVE